MHVVMANDASKQKQKHRKFSQKNKIQIKEAKPVTQPRLPKTASEVSSNWKALAVTLQANKKQQKVPKRKRIPFHKSKGFVGSKSGKKNIFKNQSDKTDKNDIWFDDVDPEDIEKVTGSEPKRRKISVDDDTHACAHSDVQPNEVTEKKPNPRVTKHVAMDCEFVGVGKAGLEHMLGRVSIVNIDGDVLYDKYVAARERVVDYRSDVSGIRPFHLRNAPNFVDVQNDVAALIKDKILIGHSISTDLKVLLLDHPRKRIRDTAKYKPFQEKLKTKHPSLKRLAKEILYISIQDGEHSSVEDARAAMKLYNTHRKEWEKSIKDKFKKNRTKPGQGS
ncbi:RNA exonuclease 4-like [Dendronephthya gigantea]|uniref:RNA exonuclease 4-like n=1 Tax=Dendronephthya gigantea TaxID=151771 RepID=UPI00106A8FBE|nr:RNA exonuclease 4-like [Dendronephthya gigantea]